MSKSAPSSSAKSAKTPSAQAQRFRWILLILGGVLILGTGFVQGLWSDRWSDYSADSLILKSRIEQIPLQLGVWEGTELESSPREIKAAGAIGHLSRSYRNTVTGEHVSMFLICGHMRDVSVHTPDRCYPAAGFEQLGESNRFEIETSAGPIDTFTSIFRQIEAAGIQQQRVFWTWGYDDQWQAPENPRLSYGGVRAMYKMYLISSVPPGVQQTPEESPCIQFARDTLGELNAILFPQGQAAEPAQESSDIARLQDKPAAQE